MIGRIGRALAAHGSHAVTLDLDGNDAVANDVTAAPGEIRRNGDDLPIGIDRHALFRREHPDAVVGPDLRLEREDVPSPELFDAQAMLSTQRPGHGVLPK